MIVAPSGVKVHIACGVTDMRKGIDGLATLVQEVLLHDPFSGHLFAFRGRRANLIKILSRPCSLNGPGRQSTCRFRAKSLLASASP
jgi:transposase